MGENVLLVYYSRTGHTQVVADAIARKLSCDVEELHDLVDRSGLRGYLRSGFDAGLARETRIVTPSRDPLVYDTLVIGGPVWNASLSSPIRTYLNRYRGKIRRAAFFLTFGGSGAKRVFAQMRQCAGCEPIAEMAIREVEIDAAEFDDRISAFVERIAGRLPPEQVVSPRLTPAPAHT